MKPVNFHGATHVMGPPKNWDNTVECDPLIVQVDGSVFTSVWKPTPEDLAMLQAGAMVVLSVFGGQPPVLVSAQFVTEIPNPIEDSSC